MSDLLKWIIGGVAFIGAIGLTLFTGGSLFPVILGMASSILISGVVEGAIAAANDGDFAEGFASGAADGALWGGIFSLGGATLRLGKILTNGVVIGESMSRVHAYAGKLGAKSFEMPGKSIIGLLGKQKSVEIMLNQNRNWINRMIRFGVKITDVGFDFTKSAHSSFYIMERLATENYYNLFINLLG